MSHQSGMKSASTLTTVACPSEGEGAIGSRSEPRVPLAAAALSRSAAAVLDGVVLNVSCSGALFVVAGDAAPPVGTGLELAFRLPTGALVRVVCVIRWFKVREPVGSTSIGLHFGPVSGPTGAYLANYIESVAASGVDGGVRAEAVAKYRLSSDASGRLSIMLAGILAPEEAASLHELLEQRLRRRRNHPLQFEVDACALRVCSHETVSKLKRCFESLAAQEGVLGLFIGSNSLALTQLLRTAREAGLGDSAFSVSNAAEAARIWQKLEA